MCEGTQTGITGAPHVGAGKVFIGYNGSDTGVRGSLVAFDANTGKEAWRFWTVPGDPSKGFESKALETASKTWAGDKWWEVGGGDVGIRSRMILHWPRNFGTAGAEPEILFGDKAITGSGDGTGCWVRRCGESGQRRITCGTTRPALPTITENMHPAGGWSGGGSGTGDDGAEEWVLLRAGCKERRVARSEADCEGELGKLGGSEDRTCGGSARA